MVLGLNTLAGRSRQLEEGLLRAFDPLPAPPPEDVATHECEECNVLRSDLGSKRWDTLADAVIEKHRADLPLLSPKAFAYFIPAFIRYALHHFTHSSLAFHYLIANLAPADDPQPDWSRERLRYLSREQMNLIGAFLQLVIEQDEFRLAFGDLESGRRRLEAMWAERWAS